MYPRNAFSGFPYYNMACFLGVRKMKTKTTGESTGQVNQQTTLLPVDCYCQYILCQCPALVLIVDKLEPNLP